MRPSVTSLGKTIGAETGGDLVVINGSGFTGVTAVKFGGIPVQNAAPFNSAITFVSDSRLEVINPSMSAGTYHVTVTTPQGTSALSSADEYTYILAGFDSSKVDAFGQVVWQRLTTAEQADLQANYPLNPPEDPPGPDGLGDAVSGRFQKWLNDAYLARHSNDTIEDDPLL